MDTSATILVADDNPDDVLLLRMAFKKAGITSPLMMVSDGVQAIQYLKGESPYADREKFPVGRKTKRGDHRRLTIDRGFG